MSTGMRRPLPFVVLALICLPLWAILELPGAYWALMIKSVLGIWILVMLKVATNRMILPGTLLSVIFFGLAWWFAPSLLMYVFGLLMFGSLVNTYKTVEQYFGGFRS